MADMGFIHEVKRLLDQCSVRPSDAAVLGHPRRRGRRTGAPLPARPGPPRGRGAIDPDAGDATHHFWKVDRTDRVSTAGRRGRPRRSDHRVLPHQARRRPPGQPADDRRCAAAAIHGDRSQAQRDQRPRGRSAAAGPGAGRDRRRRPRHPRRRVAGVVHFDPPADHKDYVHRSGRTARAGSDGVVVRSSNAISTRLRCVATCLGLDATIERADLNGCEHRAAAGRVRSPSAEAPRRTSATAPATDTVSGARAVNTAGRSARRY